MIRRDNSSEKYIDVKGSLRRTARGRLERLERSDASSLLRINTRQSDSRFVGFDRTTRHPQAASYVLNLRTEPYCLANLMSLQPPTHRLIDKISLGLRAAELRGYRRPHSHHQNIKRRHHNDIKHSTARS